MMSNVLGYRPAELRLIFQQRRSQHRTSHHSPVYALVFWYTKIPSQPNAKIRLYEVSKDLDMHGAWKAVVVDLNRIVDICPLSPVFDGPCDLDITSETAKFHFDRYFINAYASHNHFRRLRLESRDTM
jgi:hypothetical protein